MDRIPQTALEQSPSPSMEMGMEVQPDFMSYEVYKPKLQALQKEWENEVEETARRRRIRKIDVDVEKLRAAGKLKPDETLIGVRVIDENIKKEQPLFVNYLTQSDRLAIFDNRSTPQMPVKNLEVAFTKGMSYSGMLKQFYKEVDGAQAHGWDSIEVTYDPSKPLHCGIEHIGHENLLFSWQARDIQADECIMRRFKVTSSQLKSWVKKHGFSQDQVDNLLHRDDISKIPEPFEIFKCWIRYDGVVHVAWISLDSKAFDWLKSPTPLDLGRKTVSMKTEMQPVDIGGVSLMQPKQVPVITDEKETMFPVFPYIYLESEEQCITEQKGRVFFDRPWQDAQIALRTLVINGAVRASNVYGSPKNTSATGAKITKLDLTLEHGCFYSEPMEFWRTEYPDPAILRAADSLDVRKAAETGQVAASVINRDDSRKTAREFDSAEQEQAKLSLTPLMLFSGHLRDVLSFCWYIVKNQAERNEIILVPISFESVNPQTGQPMLMTINNPQLISAEYDIKPAGDTDVVRRAERISRMVNMIPILQPTPVWVEFLKDLINEILPEYSEKYLKIIDAAEQNKDQMILALSEMLKTAVTNSDGSIKPEFADKAPMLQQVFSQLPSATSNGSGQGGGQPQPAAA